MRFARLLVAIWFGGLGLAAVTRAADQPTTVDFVDELNFYNTDLHFVLKALSERTGYPFVEDIPVEGKVTIHIAKRTPIAEVLDQILRGLDLAWRLERGTYHVGRKTPKLGAAPVGGLVARTYALEVATADEAASAVRPLLSEYGKVTTDASMNTITVTDIPEIHDSIKPTLDALDVEGRRPPLINVQIKVLQIEHDGDDGTMATLEWNKRNAFESLADNFAEPLNYVPGWGEGFGGNNSIGAQNADEYYAYYPNGMTFKAGQWGIDDIVMRFYARTSTDQIHILAEPDVIVPQDKDAKITIGEKIFQWGNYYDVGIVLAVKPKLAGEDKIEMQLDPTLTESTGQNIAGSDILNSREVHTKVQVVSGGTVRVGGVVFDEKTDQVWKIPVLGDLPLLGRLFRWDWYVSKRQEVVVLASPHIVETIPPRCATTAGISALTANLVVGTSDILLDWSEDVPFDNVGVVRYNVYRDVRPIVNLEGMTPLTRDVRGDATSWVDYTPKRRGVTYWYAVTAVDGAGNEQAVSNSPSVTVPRR